MIIAAIAALVLGMIYGMADLDSFLLGAVCSHTELILYILMFSVGISIGGKRGIFRKIKAYHFKIMIIPLGVTVASVLGGVVSGLIAGYPINVSAAVGSGMGWYSLAGATLGNLAGEQVGSIAFLSNLMRELFSFFSIPFISRKFNFCSCIAVAGATSEDTTLPMMIKHTDEETVLLSVFNGIVCSAFVPFLLSFCYNLK